MSNELLKQLQKAEKKVKKDVKNRLNTYSAFGTLTDDEIALVLAMRARSLRIKQNKKQTELSEEANLSSPTTYANFEQKGTISLINFIKVMRAFGRLEELEGLLKPTVKESIKELERREKQRVR